jgi:hypothetical protein
VIRRRLGVRRDEIGATYVGFFEFPLRQRRAEHKDVEAVLRRSLPRVETKRNHASLDLHASGQRAQGEMTDVLFELPGCEERCHERSINEKTPPLAWQQDGGAGTEKRPVELSVRDEKYES